MPGTVEIPPDDLKAAFRALLDLSREAGEAIAGEQWERILEVLTRREEVIHHLAALRESGSLSRSPELDAETKEAWRALMAEDRKNMERLEGLYEEAREAVSSSPSWSRPVVGKPNAYRSPSPHFVDHKV